MHQIYFKKNSPDPRRKLVASAHSGLLSQTVNPRLNLDGHPRLVTQRQLKSG